MKFWIVSMECAGIAEAGGVKNVSFSLCKELADAGHSVTLFIPYFKCTSLELIKNLGKADEVVLQVPMCAKEESVSYQKAVCTQGDYNVIFVHHPCFEEKEAVYTYTAAEQEKNPDFVKGFGHKDTPFMDSLFCKAVSEYGSTLVAEELPDIVHCQDASCSLVPCFATKLPEFEKTSFVVTIHNAGPAYHHNFSSIGEAAFKFCESLTSIDNQSSVTRIESETFSGCYILPSITIPSISHKTTLLTVGCFNTSLMVPPSPPPITSTCSGFL